MFQHDFPFDPTCGYTEAQLLSILPPDTKPGDYEDFWHAFRKKAMSAPPQIISKQRIWSPEPDIEIFEVFYNSTDNVRIGAYLCRPKASKGGILIGHGYGNPSTPPLDYKDYTLIMPCMRGMGLSKHPQIPWEPSKHVLYGIESKETYSILGCTADLWLAASVMNELYPDTAENMHYDGGSFGGGMGALAMAWDDRFRTAYLHVPTFGHHPLRCSYQSTGSGESCRNYYAEHPECMDVLSYFDAATAATYVHIPTLLSPALFDPCVIPPGQFAVANAIPEKYRTIIILPAGHFNTPDNAPVQEKIRKVRMDMLAK